MEITVGKPGSLCIECIEAGCKGDAECNAENAPETDPNQLEADEEDES